MQKIKHIKFCEKIEIKKKFLDIKNELKVYQLTLKKK